MNDPRLEVSEELHSLDYAIKHWAYCADCDELECKCGSNNICDCWRIEFDDFDIEIWNEHYLLDREVVKGSVPNYPVADINLTLKSEMKQDTWICTLSFEDGKQYLEIHNKQ